MNEELINILLDAKRNYNGVDLSTLREIEKYFYLKDVDLNKLGNCIKESGLKYSDHFILKIVDTNFNKLYTYNPFNLSEINADKKGRMVLRSKHNSIYSLVMYGIGFKDKDYFEDEVLPTSGGMPIFINNELKYIIEVDYLKENNLKIITGGLSKYLNKEVPNFNGYCM